MWGERRGTEGGERVERGREKEREGEKKRERERKKEREREREREKEREKEREREREREREGGVGGQRREKQTDGQAERRYKEISTRRYTTLSHRRK